MINFFSSICDRRGGWSSARGRPAGQAGKTRKARNAVEHGVGADHDARVATRSLSQTPGEVQRAPLTDRRSNSASRPRRLIAPFLQCELVAAPGIGIQACPSRLAKPRRPQLPLETDDMNALDVLAEGTLALPFIGNMPQPLTADRVLASVLDAHPPGLSVSAKKGAAAYNRLHGGELP